MFYCDSGAFFFSSVKPLIDSMGDCDVWVSNISFIEQQWTKPQVFELLGITDESIKTSPQIQGSFVLCRKSERSVSLIREWLSMCVRPELIKPLEPEEPNGECIEHREDQSMLSVLCKLRGITPHKSPAILPKPRPILRRIKLLVKKLIGRETHPNKSWAGAIHPELIHNDTYSPCIYHHRIRKARSMSSVALQTLKGLGISGTIRIFRASRKDE